MSKITNLVQKVNTIIKNMDTIIDSESIYFGMMTTKLTEVRNDVLIATRMAPTSTVDMFDNSTILLTNLAQEILDSPEYEEAYDLLVTLLIKLNQFVISINMATNAVR